MLIPAHVKQLNEAHPALHQSTRQQTVIGEGRFTWRGGDKVTPYGLNALGDAKAAGYLIIEEGETDYARLTQSGIPAFGVPGATTWQSKWVDYLQDIQAIYLWQEPGSGGEALLQAIAKDLPKVRIILQVWQFLQYLGTDVSDVGSSLSHLRSQQLWISLLDVGTEWLDPRPVRRSTLFLVAPAPKDLSA